MADIADLDILGSLQLEDAHLAAAMQGGSPRSLRTKDASNRKARGPRRTDGEADATITRVVKNIPYSVNRQMLDQVLDLAEAPKYKTLHLLIDKTGQFRGMAFATFSTEEAATIFTEKVTGVEIDGRRMRVEEKKPQESAAAPVAGGPGASHPGQDEQSHPDYDAFLADLTIFTTDPTAHELQFPSTLDRAQRKVLHYIANALGLTHRSEGDGNDRYIVVGRPLIDAESYSRNRPFEIVNQQQQNSAAQLQGLIFRDRRAFSKNAAAAAAAGNGSANGAGSTDGNGERQVDGSAGTGTASALEPMVPIRQPKGPEENSIGFTRERKV